VPLVFHVVMWTRSHMKALGRIGKLVLALIFGLSLLIATADDAEISSLDLYHPATLLQLVTGRVRAVQAYVRDFRASDSDVVAAAIAAFRERIRRESPMESDPQ